MKLAVSIPDGVQLLIDKGQYVDLSAPFYKRTSSKSIRIPLADILKFQPDKIFIVLKKVVGDRVKKGDLIAEKKKLLSSKQFVSSMNGIITEVDHLTGSISIKNDDIDASETQLCYFVGEVEMIHDNHLELTISKSRSTKTKKHGHTLGGGVYYVQNLEIPLTEDQVSGLCICAEHINPIDHSKLTTLGAKALITAGTEDSSVIRHISVLDKEDLNHIIQGQYPYCITGIDQESIIFYE